MRGEDRSTIAIAMRLRAVLLLPAILGLAPMLVRCRAATQMVVEVSTDLPCDKHGGTSIAVGKLGALDARSPAATTSTCRGGTLGSLVVVPSGEDDSELAFQVTTGVGVDPSTCAGASSATCIVARRQLRFLPHESVRIRVPMKQVCANVSCDPSSTCSEGRCVSATIDTARCADGVCGEDSLGGGGADGGGPTNVPPGSDPDGGGGGGAEAGVVPLDDFDLAIGEDHACMLQGGDVYCWGDNGTGQLGSSDTYPSATPTRVSGLSEVKAIATNNNTSGAVMKDGSLMMWGEGSAPGGPSRLDGDPADRLCLGWSHLCTLAPGGKQIQCWLKGATVIERYTVDRPIATISCGTDATLLRMADGTVWSTGTGAQLGLSDAALTVGQPVQIPSLADVTNVVAHRDAVFAWRNDGSGKMWGRSEHHELIGYPSGTPAPVELPAAISGYSKIVLGYEHACGLKGGAVSCWGSNEWGQLGRPSASPGFSEVPLPIEGLGAVKNLWAGGSITCAHVESNEVYCWGANERGQLGAGTADPDIAHPAPALLKRPR